MKISAVWEFIILVAYSRASYGQNQCPRSESGPNFNTCLDKTPADQCVTIMSMLVGMDREYKGMQIQAQQRLVEMDNKINDILSRIDPCSSSPCMNGDCSKMESGFKCVCNDGFTGKTCEDKVTATDCYDLNQDEGQGTNGVYLVKLWKSQTTLAVYCDLSTAGGGWTVIQYRYNGDVDFYRNFEEYENGFGDTYEEFWLGLKHIEELSSQGPTELRLELTAADGSTWSETYRDFKLSPRPDYHLHLGHGSNSSGDSNFRMMLYNGYGFTTWDVDSDLDSHTYSNETQENFNCGISNHGGWWYGFCTANHYANLNGEYCKPGGVSAYNEGYGGMMYKDFKGLECLKISRIMIRRYVR